MWTITLYYATRTASRPTKIKTTCDALYKIGAAIMTATAKAREDGVAGDLVRIDIR